MTNKTWLIVGLLAYWYWNSTKNTNVTAAQIASDNKVLN